MKELIKYLLDNMYLDFQGEISLETVRGFLREDDGREARQLLTKLIEEKGVDDMLITLADCLREHLQSRVTEKTVREQLSMYSETEPLGSGLAEPASRSLHGLGRPPCCACARCWRCDAASGTTSCRQAAADVIGAGVRGIDADGFPVRERLEDSGATEGVLPTSSLTVRFDRYLDPVTVSRQSFCLSGTTTAVADPTQCVEGRVFEQPLYDPVRRTVTLYSLGNDPLPLGTKHSLTMLAPPPETGPGTASPAMAAVERRSPSISPPPAPTNRTRRSRVRPPPRATARGFAPTAANNARGRA